MSPSLRGGRLQASVERWLMLKMVVPEKETCSDGERDSRWRNGCLPSRLNRVRLP